MQRIFIWLYTISFLLTIGAVGASAQVDVSPGVARISYTRGDVSTQRGDSGDWVAAAINAPVVTGDKISTGDNAQAEVQFDYSNVLRLGDRAQATLAEMDRNRIQVQVGEGIVNFDTLRGSDANAEIDTPNVAVRPSRDGASVRIIVNSDDETQVIVREGQAELSTPQGSTTATRGQMITVHGTGDEAEYKEEDAPGRDDWDAWIADRNNKIENAQSWHDTNHNYTGSEDLDAYGQWKTVPDYGRVWVPTAGPDWAPYRDGRWVWEPYYGWTWVSYEPWGWAPYHYGRWMVYDSSWVWWPGPVTPYYSPVWAPAYVSFYGFGGGVGVSVGFGFGSFGWLPLGPGDFCRPWWGGYRNNFTYVNVTNVYNYRGPRWGEPLRRNGFSNTRLAETNDRVRRGISTVGAGHFGSGLERPHGIDANGFRGGRALGGNVPVVPTRASLSYSDRKVSPTTQRNGVARNFFGTPARDANRGSFERQASQLQQSIQKTGQFTPVRSGGETVARGQEGSRGAEGKPSAGIRAPENPAQGNRNAGVDNRGPARGEVNNSRNAATPRVEANNRGAVNNRPETNAVNNRSESNNGGGRFGSQPGARGNEPRNDGSQPVARGNEPQAIARGNESRPAANNSPAARGNSADGWHSFSRPGNTQNGAREAIRPESNTGSRAGNPAGPSNSGSRGFGNAPRPSSQSSQANRSFGSPETNSRSVARPPSSNSRPSSGDYRPFSSPSRGQAPSAASNTPNRSYGAPNNSPRYESNRSYGQPPMSGSNRGYSAPSNAGGNRGYSAPPSYSNGNRGYSAPPSYSGGNRGYSAPSGGSSRASMSRPPLEMRQPIVNSRPSGGGYSGGGGSRGSSAPSRGSSGGSSHASAPSHGGGSHGRGR
jgi:hypothetical protein